MLILDLWANALIAAAFAAAALCIIWLWEKRRSDWPQSWVMFILALTLTACAIARLAHSLWEFHQSIGLIAFFDWIAGITAAVGAILLPWGAWTISKLPTPKEYAETIRRAEQTEFIAERLKWQQRQADELRDEAARQRRRLSLLISLMNSLALPAEIQAKITAVVEETK